MEIETPEYRSFYLAPIIIILLAVAGLYCYVEADKVLLGAVFHILIAPVAFPLYRHKES